jgi:outer membrane protein assembly factor BamD (BamD/ComL family)
VLVLDESGTERFRSEGYLPKQEFAAQLMLGLARNQFEQKHWQEAERWYDSVLEKYGDTASAAEALYWKSVCRYKATNDHTWLAKINAEFRNKYRDSIWAEKASIFLEQAA